jgi:hypothetical protein
LGGDFFLGRLQAIEALSKRLLFVRSSGMRVDLKRARQRSDCAIQVSLGGLCRGQGRVAGGILGMKFDRALEVIDGSVPIFFS